MEPVTLLKPQPLRRKYKHFQLAAKNNSIDSRKLQFFYIGSRTKSVEFLVKSFDTGFSSSTVQDAALSFQRILNSARSMPDLLLVDASINPRDLKLFYQRFEKALTAAKTPVFIDTANTGSFLIDGFKSLSFVDDIVNIKTISSGSLLSKTAFWIKIKQTKTKELSSTIEQTAKERFSNLAKRGFDILLASTLLVLLSPLMLLIMLALRLESKGPVFYISKRAGRGYRIFNFYKFRTMQVGAEEKISDLVNSQYGAARGPLFVKIFNDPRITRLGALLRKTSLDELPQLLNILKGDMSLVGNRPLPLYEAESLTTDEWAKRFLAPAGITGLWQITRRGKFAMSAEDRIKLDVNYANRYNFLYDLWIMAKTPTALVQHTNS